MRDKSAHPLELLLEQHDIEPQAARFADPSRRCLASSAGDGDEDGIDDPPAERLGLFTCVADTRFFLRAVGEALRLPSVTVVDAGDPPSQFRSEMGGVGADLAFAGRDSEIIAVPEMGLQARVRAGNPMPHSTDLVLIEASKEARSSDAWVGLIHTWMQALSENGVVVIRGPREKEVKESAAGEADGSWHGKTHLWEAIAAVACDGSERGITAVVGDVDGGLIVLRYARAGEEGFEDGCGSRTENQAESRAITTPNPLQFEGLFLWVTEGQHTATAEAVEAVQAKFGGAEVVRRHARRRRERAACLSTIAAREAATSTEPLVVEGGGDGHLRAGSRPNPSHRGGAMSSKDVASQQYLAARACLERHLKEHTQDVRAGFALEMVLRAAGGKGVDRHVARLRAKMVEEIGPSGDLLWRALHARAAGAAATGHSL
eukprot:g11781.t1